MASLLELLMGGNAQTGMQTNPMGDMTGFQNPMAQKAMDNANMDRYQQAIQMYPRIADVPVKYKESLTNDPNFPILETWPIKEEGSKDRPRPKDIPLDVYGVENYRATTRPQDVAGDIVSHLMLDKDPVLKDIYSKFSKSMTPEQQGILKEQYHHYITKEKEPEEKTPTFKEWKDRVGMPAYFRGYAFDQWPKEEHSKYYTQDQMNLLDKAVNYLKTPKSE